MDYKKAGVDLKFADEIPGIINRLKTKYKAKGISDLSGFGGCYNLNFIKDGNQVLVSGTDGVGTKILMANKFNKLDTLGIDLVAMSVNDIITTGAKPLFFLDYIGHNKLKKSDFKKLVKGVITGCNQAGCILLGGETAEMPGVYKPGDYDLVGFAVGIVDKKNLITGKSIKAGDKTIGIASSGPHSNGFTLIRKVLNSHPALVKKNINSLLKPTRIYSDLVQRLIKKFKIKGIAHITGGGLVGNIPRVIPKGLNFELFKGSWSVPKIFKIIQEKGKISEAEMFWVFNMGIGLVCIVSSNDYEKVLKYLKKVKEKSYLIGKIS